MADIVNIKRFNGSSRSPLAELFRDAAKWIEEKELEEYHIIGVVYECEVEYKHGNLVIFWDKF